MIHIPKTIIALCCACLLSTSYAGSDASKDSARHYKSYPEKYDGETASLDCTYVTRINKGPQVEGVAFFVAHTVDDDNKMRGGSIVVAILDEDADAFAKKYGNTLDIDRDQRPKNTTKERVDSKRLRGTFHQLEKGHVYIDINGDAHERILAKIETAKGCIRAGDGIPSGDNRRSPNHKHGKKHKF